MNSFDLVLPCYNEAPSLVALCDRVIRCARERGWDQKQFRLILVDNGSSDDTPKVMEAISQGVHGSLVHVVRVPINRGYGYGVLAGLSATRRGGIVGWSHADEQCDPADAFRAWELVNASPERILVKGKRRGRTMGQWAFSRAFELTAWILTRRILHEINAQPKVFPQVLVDRLSNAPEGFAFDAYVLLRAIDDGFQIRSIDVHFPPRRHGQSRWAATFASRMRTIRGMVRFLASYRRTR